MNQITLLDGAQGTLLWQKAEAQGIPKASVWTYNLTHPELVSAVCREYADAGSEIICANTFGINRFTVLSFLALTIMGPLQCIAEEYIFRGFFLQTIGSWVKIPIVAIVVSALVFTAGHPYKLAGVISVLVSGLIWGFMAKTTRGLEASSAAHIANNMAVFYTMGFGIVKLTAEIPVADMIVSVVKDAVYLIVIFIIARKTNWFNEVQADDVKAFNEKVEAKMAAKAAKN